uniref:Nudix hydrolase domain-containing protein n=1 Tax=Phaeomonas parva TaxID=124430 RepID=A0A7S1U685_9STRA|mmetsp:Transcript_33272/g.105222  ORF Transcript_33272/g.105222 Transcript_33272/m.105222 type:complete len:261 (+) Transcript_33272:782-1564(+)
MLTLRRYPLVQLMATQAENDEFTSDSDMSPRLERGRKRRGTPSCDAPPMHEVDSPGSDTSKADYLEAKKKKTPKQQSFHDGMVPARRGREKQRFECSTRLCAGVVPVLKGNVVLIKSQKRKEWILPKGGWESDETIEAAAARECYEEAGVRGTVNPERYLETVHMNSRGVSCRTRFYLLDVTEVLDEWPEMHRDRKMVPVDEARKMVKREWLSEALALAEGNEAAPPKDDSKGAARQRAPVVMFALAALSVALYLRTRRV